MLKRVILVKTLNSAFRPAVVGHNFGGGAVSN